MKKETEAHSKKEALQAELRAADARGEYFDDDLGLFSKQVHQATSEFFSTTAGLAYWLATKRKIISAGCGFDPGCSGLRALTVAAWQVADFHQCEGSQLLQALALAAGYDDALVFSKKDVLRQDENPG